MKKILIILTFMCFGFSVDAQEVVRNQGVKRQVESMVISRWSKRYFRPKWYYKLVHNRYRKGGDKRLMRQLVPTLATAKKKHEETEDEQDKVNEDFVDEMAINADKLVNTKYDLLYKDRINELFFALQTSNFNSSLEILNGYTNSPFQITEHDMVIQNFQERKKLIKDSYSPSFEKNLEYDKLIEDMEKYMSMIIKLQRKLKAYKRYAPLTQPIQD